MKTIKKANPVVKRQQVYLHQDSMAIVNYFFERDGIKISELVARALRSHYQLKNK